MISGSPTEQSAEVERLQSAGQFLGEIYAFVFALLLSYQFMDSPIVGGTFYLCGRIGCMLIGTRDLKNYLSKRQFFFYTFIYCLLLITDAMLFFRSPYRTQNHHVSTVLAVLITILAEDFLFCVFGQKLTKNSRKKDWILYFSLQFSFALIGTCILFTSCSEKRILAFAYLVMFVLREYSNIKSINDFKRIESEAFIAFRTVFRQGYSYRLFESVSVLVLMGACISVIFVYCTLSLTSTEIVMAMMLALLCMTVAAFSAKMYMNRKQARHRLEASSLTLWGLVFWMTGLYLYRNHSISIVNDTVKGFVGMGLCSYGISLTLYCLEKVEQTIQLSTMLYAQNEANVYQIIARSRNSTAILISELIALLLVNFSFAYFKKSYIHDMDYPMHFRTFLLVPATILVLLAFFAMLLFPINNRYEQKLKRLLGLEANGVKNTALHEQIEKVFINKCWRPIGTNIIKGTLRLFFRHKLNGREKIQEDETNPIVFLCNHGDIYGPITAMVNLPVPIRPWVISDMFADAETFAFFINKNNLSKIHWIPENWKMGIARFVGRISVWAFNQLESIPVYRNVPAKLILTLKRTVAAMEAGDNILIFPENPDANPDNPGYLTEGVGPFFDGFALLADIYCRKTKKKCRFLPMFACKETWNITIGDEIVYNPQTDPSEERTRIATEAYEQMKKMHREQTQFIHG